MKYILILIVSFTFGQEIIFEKSKKDTFEYIFTAEKNAVAKELTNGKIINKPITINDVFDYIEYCNNDSVAWETDVTDSTEWINGFPIYHRSWVTIMIPKRPTFIGFAKWYRSKE